MNIDTQKKRSYLRNLIIFSIALLIEICTVLFDVGRDNRVEALEIVLMGQCVLYYLIKYFYAKQIIDIKNSGDEFRTLANFLTLQFVAIEDILGNLICVVSPICLGLIFLLYLMDPARLPFSKVARGVLFLSTAILSVMYFFASHTCKNDE